MTDLEPSKRPRKLAAAILACYWLALFLGTHLPHPPEALLSGARDKTLHLTAYAGLAFLASWNVWLRGVLGWRQRIGIAFLLAIFGAFDEITQIPVGRSCDFADWVADALGIAGGSALFMAATALLSLKKRPPVDRERKP